MFEAGGIMVRVVFSVHANFAVQNAPHHAVACLRHDARCISAEVQSYLVSQTSITFLPAAKRFSKYVLNKNHNPLISQRP